MEIKTSELIGTALDWAVAQIESGAGPDRAEKQWRYFGRVFHPSTDWAQGGPIIEREKISMNSDYNGAHTDPWVAETFSGGIQQAGPTPLIAAMRCYVASKLGDEVDVPDEIL